MNGKCARVWFLICTQTTTQTTPIASSTAFGGDAVERWAMSETVPGTSALTSYIRTGNREDRTAYRSLPEGDRATYRRLVAAVYTDAVHRYFGNDLSKEAVDHLIARTVARHPEYAGSVKLLLRALLDDGEGLCRMTPRQALTAQHLVIREIARRRPELQVEADLAVGSAVYRLQREPADEPIAIRPSAEPTARIEPVEASEAKPPTTDEPAPAVENDASEEDESPSPGDFKIPESYEAQIAEAQDFIRHIPASPNLKAAEQILASAPGREEIEELQRKAAEGRALVKSIESARYEGSSADGTVTVTLDATGRLRSLDLHADAGRLGNHDFADRIRAACTVAGQRRADESAALNDRSRAVLAETAPGAGGRAIGDAEILRRIESFQAEREDARFEHVSASGHCRAEVNQRGALTDLVFLTGNVIRAVDGDELVKDVCDTVSAAQREAAEAVSAMTAELLQAAA